MMGGEFDFSLDLKNKVSPQKAPFNTGFFYSSGRAALFYIIKHALIQKEYSSILLPDYLCDSVLDTLRIFNSTIDFDFYPIKSNLTVDFEQLANKYQKHSIVLFINYFGGRPPLPYYERLRAIDSECCIIEDNVQALFNMFEYSSADYRFTSFRKSLPVPDGGWVLSLKDDMEIAEKANHFAQYKMAGAAMKRSRIKYPNIDDHFYLSLFEEGEKLISNDIESKMSEYTRYALRNIDLCKIKECRMENGHYLIEQLQQIGLSPIIAFDDRTPLFIPIRLKNRDKIRKALFAHHIFCPIHWPVLPQNSSILGRGYELSTTELSLIIDQRYSLRDMDKMVTIIKKEME